MSDSLEQPHAHRFTESVTTDRSETIMTEEQWEVVDLRPWPWATPRNSGTSSNYLGIAGTQAAFAPEEKAMTDEQQLEQIRDGVKQAIGKHLDARFLLAWDFIDDLSKFTLAQLDAARQQLERQQECEKAITESHAEWVAKCAASEQQVERLRKALTGLLEDCDTDSERLSIVNARAALAGGAQPPVCKCGCSFDRHRIRTHEVERGSHYCEGCKSIHDCQSDGAQEVETFRKLELTAGPYKGPQRGFPVAKRGAQEYCTCGDDSEPNVMNCCVRCHKFLPQVGAQEEGKE